VRVVKNLGRKKRSPTYVKRPRPGTLSKRKNHPVPKKISGSWGGRVPNNKHRKGTRKYLNKTWGKTLRMSNILKLSKEGALLLIDGGTGSEANQNIMEGWGTLRKHDILGGGEKRRAPNTRKRRIMTLGLKRTRIKQRDC